MQYGGGVTIIPANLSEDCTAVKGVRMVHVLCLCLSAGAISGCGWSPFARRDICADLQHEDPSVRLAAIHRAGREKMPEAVPYLVDRLTDSEEDVRFFAIEALKRITGLDHGYRYWDSRAGREQALERWSRWLTQGRGKTASSRPAKERKLK